MELDKIEKLAELKEKGMISEEEYAEAKSKVLSSGATRSPREVASGMDNRTYSMLLHFSQLCGYVVPFLGLAVPVVLWAIRREDSYIDQQGKAVFNWMISSFIYFVVCLVLTMVVVGVFLLALLGLVSIVFVVLGAIRAKDGVIQDYPLSIPFFTVTPAQEADGD